jgi:hypothetical protein
MGLEDLLSEFFDSSMSAPGPDPGDARDFLIVGDLWILLRAGLNVGASYFFFSSIFSFN